MPEISDGSRRDNLDVLSFLLASREAGFQPMVTTPLLPNPGIGWTPTEHLAIVRYLGGKNFI
jgi:hypothetical protein